MRANSTQQLVMMLNFHFHGNIGYGLPATQTPGGRFASIVYIMIGIPLFLLILAEVGKLLSRGLRKLYKRMHKMKRLPEAARRMSEPMKVAPIK